VGGGGGVVVGGGSVVGGGGTVVGGGAAVVGGGAGACPVDGALVVVLVDEDGVPPVFGV
jgi:hypothetical protein